MQTTVISLNGLKLYLLVAGWCLGDVAHPNRSLRSDCLSMLKYQLRGIRRVRLDNLGRERKQKNTSAIAIVR